MPPVKKKAAVALPKKTGIPGFSPTKSGKPKVAKAIRKAPAKAKWKLEDVYAEVMAGTLPGTSEAYLDEAEGDEDYLPDKEDEGDEEDNDDDGDADMDAEAIESSGTESEDEGEGEVLTAQQKRTKAKLDNDPRYLTNRRRGLKKHKQIVARAEEDGQEWNGVADENLGDIIKPDKGGRYRLVPDKAGTILEQHGGIFYDTKTRQSFRKVRKLQEKSALPYEEGEVPVMAMKTELLDEEELPDVEEEEALPDDDEEEALPDVDDKEDSEEDALSETVV